MNTRYRISIVLLLASMAASRGVPLWAQQPEPAPAAPEVGKLIRQLQAPSADARYRALVVLRGGGRVAAGALIDVLASPDRAAEHANVRAALARMGSQAVDPLLGTLEGADPELAVQAIRVLAAMDAREAPLYLLRPYFSETGDPKVRAAAGAAIGRLTGEVPSRREAVRVLTTRALAYFDRQQPIEGVVDGRIGLWSWDAEKARCVSRRYTAEDATVVMAARLARDAYAVAADDPPVRRLYLATMLEAAANETGWDGQLPRGEGTAVDRAAQFGVAVIEDVMQYAIQGGHMAAATAAARILGRIGTAEELLYQGATPAPLVVAARHPDRRLRMAATDAVVRLQPLRPFAGSSHVLQSLGFCAASSGMRRALVAGPSTETSRIAGTLARMGFEVDTAAAGRELFRLAVASPDYELALIDAAIQRPTADMLLQQLHRDWRSASLRVGLIAGSGHLQRAGRIARRDPMAMAFSRPHSEQAITWQVEQLATLAPRAFVDHAQRQHQAAEALDRLAELGDSQGKLYDLRQIQDSVFAALYAPNLGIKAAAVLGTLGTPKSQRALADLAGRRTQPWDVRGAAVAAFRRTIQRHGILLTSDEITRQYDRYNQSEGLDAATQNVLGLILDCIEAPHALNSAIRR